MSIEANLERVINSIDNSLQLEEGQSNTDTFNIPLPGEEVTEYVKVPGFTGSVLEEGSGLLRLLSYLDEQYTDESVNILQDLYNSDGVNASDGFYDMFQNGLNSDGGFTNNIDKFNEDLGEYIGALNGSISGLHYSNPEIYNYGIPQVYTVEEGDIEDAFTHQKSRSLTDNTEPVLNWGRWEHSNGK